MDQSPSVSVIIVSHARPESLRRTIGSLRFQRVRGFEVVVVADHDPDLPPGLPFEVIALRFDEANISKARNLGLAAARGDVVVFIDDDAIPEFGWLAALTGPFSNPRIAAATGNVRGRNGVSFQWQTVLVDRFGADTLHVASDRTEVFPPGNETILKTVGCNAAFRRTALQKVGGFDTAYRFFLDEVDLNVRLNRAGWMSAMVPSAEVHHAYAPGPHRNSHRTPTSLFELGASKAYFCRKMLSPEEVDPALRHFRKVEERRLTRAYLHGMVDADGLAELRQSLEDGFADGMERVADVARIEPHVDRTLPPLSPRDAKRTLLSTGPLDRRKRMAEASEHAGRGEEVTLIDLEPTVRRLSVRFDEPGFWYHRLGLFGRDERAAPLRPAGRSARLARELARIDAQRGLMEPKPV